MKPLLFAFGLWIIGCMLIVNFSGCGTIKPGDFTPSEIRWIDRTVR